MPKMDRKEKRFWELFHGFKNEKAIPEVTDRLFYKEMELYDEHLEYISRRVKKVDRLEMNETYVTDTGLEALTKMERIKELQLKSLEGVTDAAIPVLSQIKGLELLHLGGTSVTVNGAKGLSAAANLNRLILSRGNATDAEIEALKAALPNCDVAVNP
ncbi:hypothetical protein BXY85_0497 [Roseivirga pacifica]|uniref:Leucine Rich repeat-containing protein n=3 Tax=Roseivirga pacifica TaxID=1267423 RepID=A0A1I0RFI6_9BACT|nr:hypothetical protein BXY85_0497 [Roseivirga pacifica]SEW39426.1 hypothetical protein SAMN05216290_3443 [Roseivirga pacifica]